MGGVKPPRPGRKPGGAENDVGEGHLQLLVDVRWGVSP
jgi:hypothetical protein